MTRRRQPGFLQRLAAVFSPSRLAPDRTAPRRSLRRSRSARIAAAYDSAQTTELNSRHWRQADELSAASAMTAEIRKIIRSRSRYECQESNSVAKGMVLTLANDTIGCGPRLQMLLPDKKANLRIEQAFGRWAHRIRLAEKLRTMRVAKAVDGEALGLFVSRRRRDLDVQLDLRLIEADQVDAPWMSLDPRERDGVRFGPDNEVEAYYLFDHHPGDTGIHGFNPLAGRWVDAANVLHIFREDRPGQIRGISELAPALPLFALLRDYTLAVLHAARSAAKFTAVLETAAGAREDDGSNWDPDVEAFDMVDIDYDMITSLPFGWKLNQFKSEQPTTTFKEFREAIINEIARCLNMPFNVAAANSAQYNYASGRLDHQVYYRSIDVELSQWEANVLDRILEAWFDEAVLVPGLLPPLGPMPFLPHQWNWDGREHVDPQKEANAQDTRLRAGTTHRNREYARDGLDVDAEDAIAAASYGVTIQEYRRRLFDVHFPQSGSTNAAPNDSEDDRTEPESDGHESEETAEAQAAGV